MGLGLGAQSRLIRDGLAVDQPRLPTWNRLGVLRPAAVHGLSKLPVFLPAWRSRLAVIRLGRKRPAGKERRLG